MVTMTAIFAAAVGIVSLLVSCGSAHRNNPFELVKFGYSGPIGPSNWGSLSPDYSLCSKGTHQSPINIEKKDTNLDANLKSLERHYNATNCVLINNGFNIMLKYRDDVGSVLVDGKNYTLKQMQWHSPSEHTIDGERFPLELHLLHMSDDGNVAVVAILYQFGDPDPLLSDLKEKVEELTKEVCSDDEESHVQVGEVDTKSIKRGTRKYYRYVGSLTTPPCTENVIWNILGKVREISKEQLEMLMKPLDEEYRKNSRPTQPLNGRKVSLYNEEALEDLKNH